VLVSGQISDADDPLGPAGAMTLDPLVASFLDSSAWMRSLTPAQAKRVRDDLSVRNFAVGETVCARSTPSAHWIGVAEGMLKLETIAEDGRSVTVAGVPSGAWMGEGAVLKGEPRPYDLVALRDSVVAFLPRTTFLWLLDESHPFALWLVRQLNARLGHFVALVQNFRMNDSTAQVAYGVSELFNSTLYPGTERQLTISQEEIGRLCGVSRQIANRVLRELQDRGAIRQQYGSVEVTDLPLLQRIARGQKSP